MKNKESLIIVLFFSIIVQLSPTSGSSGELSGKSMGITSNEEWLLVVGDQKIIDAKGISSFSESARGIIEVKVPKDGSRMIITAIRHGTTSLLLIGSNGEQRIVMITVYALRPETVMSELRELLGQSNEIELRRVGPRVFIDGAVSSPKALKRIDRAAKLYRGQVASLVQTDENVVQPRTNIRLDLAFVELRSRKGYNVGLSWPPSYGATGTLSGNLDLMTGTMSAAYKVVDQAIPSLEMAARHGWAKIRKKATVVTTSGHQASYSAGGEINIAIAGSQAAELRKIPYGARLVVTPRLGRDDRILDLDVEAEVSDLTETTMDVPGRTVSKVQTLVHLNLGQSIMLSGLDSETESTTVSGLPLLSKIPILGLLFGNREHNEERVDGLIFITPSVIDNLDRAGKRLLDEALQKFAAFRGKFK